MKFCTLRIKNKEDVLLAHTAWALIPPLITVVLAMVTKEVYSALIIGVFAGALLFTGFDFLGSINTMFSIITTAIGENAFLLVFLVLLGIFVSMINKSGASQAYGEWAAKAIKGKRMAMLITMLLGVIIFIDDYFNCLTVGTVMRPVTDKFHITRAKLAYVIDATAAPVCILAPVSSWAAAVASSFPEGSGVDGFSLFVHTVPLNLYAWLTLFFMLFMIWSGKDYSKMKALEEKERNELYISTEPDKTAATVIVKKLISCVPTTATTIGINIPNVPQELPVEKDKIKATKKNNVGNNVIMVVFPLTKAPIYPPRSINSLLQTPANPHANANKRIAGVIDLKPSI